MASRLLGDENVETDTRTLGGEDMSVYLARVPGCFFFVGCAGEGRCGRTIPRVSRSTNGALAVGVVLLETAARKLAGAS